MTELCNQTEAFASDLGDDQSRYLFELTWACVVLCLCLQVCGVTDDNVKPKDSTGACVTVVLSSWSALCQPSFRYHFTCHYHCHVYVVSFHLSHLSCFTLSQVLPYCSARTCAVTAVTKKWKPRFLSQLPKPKPRFLVWPNFGFASYNFAVYDQAETMHNLKQHIISKCVMFSMSKHRFNLTTVD